MIDDSYKDRNPRGPHPCDLALLKGFGWGDGGVGGDGGGRISRTGNIYPLYITSLLGAVA